LVTPNLKGTQTFNRVQEASILLIPIPFGEVLNIFDTPLEDSPWRILLIRDNPN
jgi:hypothetical protein